MPHAAELPEGWSYNPSAWSERLHVLAVAGAGFLIATYLALYQWGAFSHVWEPFFGSGSRTVLHSAIARALPVPDSAFGALAYLTDGVTAMVGGPVRWRTMPWIVLVFGGAVCAFGTISTFLVIAQPVLFDAWCTLCLGSALLSVLLVGPAMDEVLAALQHLRREQARGHSLWRALRGR